MEATKKKKTAKKKTEKTVKTKKIEEKNIKKSDKALCHLCGKGFSKSANVNAHIQKDHKGLRWVCPICNQAQVTRYSHKRHLKAKHADVTNINPDSNARFMDDILPEAAKDAIIANLKERIQSLEVLAKHFRSRLLNKLNENITLKAQLGLETESDKLEYNNLIGAESESSENSVENSEDEQSVEKLSTNSGDDDESNHNPTVSTNYPENRLETDSLKHIEESDRGACGSRL